MKYFSLIKVSFLWKWNCISSKTSVGSLTRCFHDSLKGQRRHRFHKQRKEICFSLILNFSNVRLLEHYFITSSSLSYDEFKVQKMKKSWKAQHPCFWNCYFVCHSERFVWCSFRDFWKLEISYKIRSQTNHGGGYQVMPEIWPSNLFYSSPEDSICILSDRSNGPAISFDSNDLKYPLTPRIRQFNSVQRHVINLT